MLRKLSLVAVAAASLGAAALAPTSASAWGGWHMAAGIHGWGWGGPRIVVGGPAYYGGGYGGCYVRRLVADPLGPPLAAGQPLLLMLDRLPPDFDAPAVAPGPFCSRREPMRSSYLLAMCANDCERKQIPASDLIVATSSSRRCEAELAK